METTDITAFFTPVQGIIVYQNKSKAQWDSPEYYLENRSILKGENGELQFSEGQPLQKKTLASLGEALAKESTEQYTFKGLIPDNLLFFDRQTTGNRFIWYVPPKEHHFFFTDNLKIPDGQIKTPLLIFEAHNNRLSVYATKTKRKPTLATKLFNAPFHNVYSSGNICLGNGKRGKKKLKYYSDVLQSWEKLFWSTAFSHINHNPIKGNLNMLYKKLIETKEPFPTKVLKPSLYKNLQALIEK